MGGAGTSSKPAARADSALRYTALSSSTEAAKPVTVARSTVTVPAAVWLPMYLSKSMSATFARPPIEMT